MKTFGQLFKKYRLQAEFASLAELADQLAQKGYYYDISVFSHWQAERRIPGNRHLILTLIEIFFEHNAITSLDQANEFLESAGHGYLTAREQTQKFINL